MTPEDTKFTQDWWTAVVKDEARLIRWLQKLQATEFSGYADNRTAAARWTEYGSAAANIFIATGDDEMRHSDLLVEVLEGRGAWPVLEAPPESLYWAEMEEVITSLEQCAAVFHFGEQLASDRFQILLDHPGTPTDIKGFLLKALPDEKHHARIFRKLSTPAVLRDIIIEHERIVKKLKAS